MRYKGVAFDFDYTLGDSTEGIVLCANYGLEKLGFSKAQYDDIKKTIGLSLSDTYQMLTGDNNEEKKERFVQYFKEKADQVMTANASLYDGVSKLLKEMKASGLKLAVVTTKYHCRIEEIFKKYNLSGVLDEIIGSDDVVNPKPAPEGIKMLLDSWDMKEEELLYVGDSLVDAKAAAAAKVSFAAVTSGTTTQEMFQHCGYSNIGIYSGVEELRNLFIQEKETILISACLLGVCCRYNGEGQMVEEAEKLRENYHLIPVCPEILGGLETPRLPSEIKRDQVFRKDGVEVTEAFKRGAKETLKLAQFFGCKKAILKERSPSCGAGNIYDGSFTGKIIEGNGIAVSLLKEHGILVAGESQIHTFLSLQEMVK